MEKIETEMEKIEEAKTPVEAQWFGLYNRLIDLLCKKVGCKIKDSTIKKCGYCPIYIRSQNVTYYYSMGWHVFVKNCCYEIKEHLKTIVSDTIKWLLNPFSIRRDTTTNEWYIWNEHTQKKLPKADRGDPDHYYVIRTQCTKMNTAYAEEYVHH